MRVWKSGSSRTSCIGCAVNRAPNAVIGSAATDVSRHRLCNLFIRRMRILGQQRGCGHDLSALAVAALRNFFRDPRLLKRIQSVGGESLDCGDALSRNLGDQRGTRAHRSPVHVHRASATETGTAAELRATEFQRVAQHPEQRRLWRNADFALAAIYPQSDVRHMDPDWSG